MDGFFPGTYTHSGKIGPAMVAVPIVAVVGSLLLALAYGYLTIYIPIAGYVSLLLVLGYGVGLTALVSVTGRMAKCRSGAFLRLMGVLTGLLGLYAAWVAFEFALYQRFDPTFDLSLWDLFSHPSWVWRLVEHLNRDGWYTVFSHQPKGVELWIFWAIEAVIVVGMPTLLATMSIKDEVFCEDCGQWCEGVGEPLRVAVPEDAGLIEALQTGRVDVLEHLPTVSVRENPHIRIDVKRCAACQRTAAFQAKFLEHTVDEQGKEHEKTENLTGMVLLDPGQFEQLAALSERPPRPPAAAPVDAEPAEDDAPADHGE